MDQYGQNVEIGLPFSGMQLARIFAKVFLHLNVSKTATMYKQIYLIDFKLIKVSFRCNSTFSHCRFLAKRCAIEYFFSENGFLGLFMQDWLSENFFFDFCLHIFLFFSLLFFCVMRGLSTYSIAFFGGNQTVA